MASGDSHSKRLFDIILAAGILVLFFPLLLFLAFAVKVTSSGPIFFTGQRIGRGGRPFRIIKFRTMVGNAEKLGPTVTAGGDPRITRIGDFLRRTKLDELPTLINVLRGEMSIVGPRPETPPWIALYTPEERRVLLAQPGITSLATIEYRHEEKLLAGKKIEQAYPPIMRDKLQMELEYLRTRSFLTDLRIIALTIQAIFQKHPHPNSRSASSLHSMGQKVSPQRRAARK
jgi:lipopolysaccharide/colanic/teichoic acid biosynthesis glycosyltransferase